MVGVAYKPGVQDVRESPSLEILAALERAGCAVAYHDPLIPTLTLGERDAAQRARAARRATGTSRSSAPSTPAATTRSSTTARCCSTATYRVGAGDQRHTV